MPNWHDPTGTNPNATRGSHIAGAARNTVAVGRAAGNPNSANGVWFPLFLAFTIKVLAEWKGSPSKSNIPLSPPEFHSNDFIQSLVSQNYGGWIVLFGILFLMSDINTTHELAIAFAWLIAIAIILSKGEDALKRVGFFPQVKDTKFSYLTQPKKKVN